MAFANTITVSEEEEYLIFVEGKKWKFFTSYTLISKLNSIDTLQCSAPFEAAEAAIRELFLPFRLQEIAFYIRGELLFSGYIMNVAPQNDENQSSIVLNAYARAGILSDTVVPPEFYPLEWNNTQLSVILQDLISPFGIELVDNLQDSTPFVNVSIGQGQSILNFIRALLGKRKAVLYNDAQGNLVIDKIVEKAPLLELKKGQEPLLSNTLNIDQQSTYGRYIYSTANTSLQDSESVELVNPLMQDASIQTYKYVPLQDVENGDLLATAQDLLNKTLAESISYDVLLAGIRDANGGLLEKGSFVRLQDPDTFLAESYTFLLDRVEFRVSSNTERSILSLVFPNVYSGEVLTELPF